MSKVYKKQIFPLGEHLVSDASGNRHKVTLERDRVLNLINTFNNMRSNGLKVYAPWEHDDNFVPVKDVDDLLNAKNNGGEWLAFYLEGDVLYGNIKAATDEDAERIGNTVEGCSVFIDKYVDGTGKEWDDAFLHVALTNKPVAVTDNFEENNSGLAIAMSTSTNKKDSDPSQEMQTLTEVLKTKFGIDIPQNVTDICEYLRMLAGVLKNFNNTGEQTTTVNSPMEILMSTSKNKPEEVEEPTIWEKRAKKLAAALKDKESQLGSLVKHIGKSYKEGLNSRISGLKEAFEKDEEFGPKVLEFEKSLTDLELEFDFEKASLIPPSIETEIGTLEAFAKRIAPKPEEEKTPEKESYSYQQPPEDSGSGVDMSDEDVTNLLASI